VTDHELVNVDTFLKMVPDRVKNSKKFQEFLTAVREKREGETYAQRQKRLTDLWEDLYGE